MGGDPGKGFRVGTLARSLQISLQFEYAVLHVTFDLPRQPSN